MASQKDVKKEIGKLRREGFLIERSSNAHYMIIDPDTQQVVASVGGTPSDFRSIRNFRATMRPLVLALRERKGGKKVPAVSNDLEVVERDIALRERIRKTIHDLEVPQGEFAMFAKGVAEKTGIRGYKTGDAARMAIKRFLEGGRPAEWAAQMYEVALDQFVAKPAMNGQPETISGADLLAEQAESAVDDEPATHLESAAKPEPAMVVQGDVLPVMSVHDLPDTATQAVRETLNVEPPQTEADLAKFPLHMRVMVGLLKPGLDVASCLALCEEIRQLEDRA